MDILMTLIGTHQKRAPYISYNIVIPKTPYHNSLNHTEDQEALPP